MNIQLFPAISSEQAMAMSALLEKKLKEFPELDVIFSRTGQIGVAVEARGVETNRN